ncbi:MAG: YgiQ family radical SAM protein [Bacteroidales bacterium]|nr:YgiQ family radical SAM protein [Bacteroidales bacterium]
MLRPEEIRHPKFLPTTKDEVRRLGWEQLDVILFSGDAYIDHPSFGTAVIARVLEHAGYKVGVVPQPNWRDDLRDFKKLGRPRLFFGVNAGAMDSMVNHYTSFKRLRSNDSYTPNGAAGFRPDYAVTVYSKILKQLYPDVPVVIGGIEASLRRFTHYDFWQDRLLPSVLVSSGADYLTYGMGEKNTLQIARYIDGNKDNLDKRNLLQTAYFSTQPPEEDSNTTILPSYEQCCSDKKAFIRNFNEVELQANLLEAKRLIEPCQGGFVYVNEPFPPMSQQELDSVYDLPYTFLPHPRYKGKPIPAYEMIKNSITIHRGCFGGCSFCTIAAHQGKFIQSRSKASVIREIEQLKTIPGFSGNISDVGAPSANMYRMGGKDKNLCLKCRRKSCLFPKMCPNLDHSHKALIDLYRDIDKIKGIRHSFIGSGVRYDLLMDENGFLDDTSKEYFTELISKHVSGRFKVAPEHTEDHVLNLMNKPSFKLFCTMKREFEKINNKQGLNQQIVPYFISSHPGCRLSDMKALSENKNLKGVFTEQVQSFTPTPMTRSSVMYYTGLDTKTLKPVFVEKNINRLREQKSYFFK